MSSSRSHGDERRIVRGHGGWVATMLAVAVVAAATTTAAADFGVRHQAMAGTGVALHLGAESVSINPASAAYLGDSRDVGWTMSAFENRYGTGASGSVAADDILLIGPGQTSDAPRLASLGAAVSWVLDEDEQFHLMVSLAVDEVLHTDFDHPVFEAPGGSSLDTKTGLTLRHYELAPTFAMMIGERHGIGIAPVLALQSFQATGLSALADAGLSTDPTHLSDQGTSVTPGFGVRVGYLGEWLDFLAVGISYRSPVWMSKLDDYAGLIAEQGSLDAPASLAVGLSLGFSAMGVAADYQRIFTSDVAALSNGLTPNARVAGLGDDNGAGLGWDDVDRWKVGAWYTLNSGVVFRAGFAHQSQPASSESITANVIAPELSQDRLAIGVTKPIAFTRELTIQVTRYLAAGLSGPNGLDSTGQQEIDLHQEGWEFGMGLSF